MFEVSVVSETMLIPELARMPAHIMPGMNQIDLDMASPFDVGISLTVDMISIRRDEYATKP